MWSVGEAVALDETVLETELDEDFVTAEELELDDDARERDGGFYIFEELGVFLS